MFVKGTEVIKFKAKDSEIAATPLCLGNISKDFTVDNMKKTGLNGHFYDFSVDYDAIAVGGYKVMFGFLKKCFYTAMTFFSCIALKCVPINNQECKIRSEIIDINNNELKFYPYSK